MLDRRQFLFAGAAALSVRSTLARDTQPAACAEICARIPDYPRLFTLTELQQRIDNLQRLHPALMSRRVIGASKKGMPIELVSVGQGRRSALLVAGLHPNEPVGSLSADFLMTELCRNEALRRQLDFTWHFINPVDPDGMRLNESWLRRPLTLERYVSGLFRPALARQAEYTFPLQVDSFSFDDSVPENMAWRKALELTKPQLQYTQHNADYGGAFFLTSAPDADLERALRALPAQYGVSLNRVGEPMAEIEPRAEGVFSLPMPALMLAPLAGKGSSASEFRRHWPAGDSSTSYASRYGTFSFSAEVPFWDDARIANHDPSDWTLAKVLREFIGWNVSAAALVAQWEPKLAMNPSEPELAYALAEYSNATPTRLAQVEAMLSTGKLERVKLTVADAAMYRTTLRLSLLRPVSFLSQLARAWPEEKFGEAKDQAEAFIARHLAEMRAEAELRTIALRSLVAIQVSAGLMAAAATNRRSG